MQPQRYQQNNCGYGGYGGYRSSYSRRPHGSYGGSSGYHRSVGSYNRPVPSYYYQPAWKQNRNPGEIKLSYQSLEIYQNRAKDNDPQITYKGESFRLPPDIFQRLEMMVVESRVQRVATIFRSSLTFNVATIGMEPPRCYYRCVAVDQKDVKEVAIGDGRTKKEAKKNCSLALWKEISQGQTSSTLKAAKALSTVSGGSTTAGAQIQTFDGSAHSCSTTSVVAASNCGGAPIAAAATEHSGASVSVEISLFRALAKREPLEALYEGSWYLCTVQDVGADGKTIIVEFEGFPGDLVNLGLSSIRARQMAKSDTPQILAELRQGHGPPVQMMGQQEDEQKPTAPQQTAAYPTEPSNSEVRHPQPNGASQSPRATAVPMTPMPAAQPQQSSEEPTLSPELSSTAPPQVLAEHVKKPAQPAAQNSNPSEVRKVNGDSFKLGDRVQALYEGEWYPASIIARQGENSGVQVLYDGYPNDPAWLDLASVRNMQ